MSLVRLFQAVRPQTCGVAHTAVQTVCVRNMAADPKAAKVNKMKSNAAPPASIERGVALRLNEFQILKDTPPVQELPDKEYPEWLWTVHLPDPTLADLKKIGYESMTEEQKRRYFKLERRERIKAANSAKAMN